MSRCLRAFAFCSPLVPRRFKSCCVDGEELCGAIQREIDDPQPHNGRTYTLLGPNRPWKTLLREHRGEGFWARALTTVTTILSLLLVGQLLGLVFDALGKVGLRLRCWNFDTLLPESNRELLALYNRYNFRHVKIVGYNNGVVHFGQHFPGKTIVSTVRCDQVAEVSGNLARFDAGVTIRRAVDVLGRAGKEFYVIPNYSYVSLGTTFFVPVHGSASEYSTMGDTIEKVSLYDPIEDRLITATREEPAFRHSIYNLKCDILLLRLYVRVKEKSRYYMKKETLADPTSQELLAALRDDQPSNVEVRKAKASNQSVQIYRYYTQRASGNSETLEFPRDTVGRLWDRLETNPLLSVLFHGLMRRFGYHVELFFTAEEFATFWNNHGHLPITKIQLRHIKRDGFPHSPFREHDCVSADLFMLRKHKQAFETYVQETFRAVQFNPGKHSR